jgi:hypothetical protein
MSYWEYQQEALANAAAAARQAEYAQRDQQKESERKITSEINKIVGEQLPGRLSTLKSEIKSELPNMITIQTNPIKLMLEQYIQQLEGKMTELKGYIDAQLIEQQRLLEGYKNELEKLKKPVSPPTQKPPIKTVSSYLAGRGGKRNRTYKKR